MTMIERVTKAIQDRDIAWHVERFPEHEEAIRRAAICDLSGNYEALAKAAIEAMRVPDSAMLNAASKAMSPDRRPTPKRVSVKMKHRIRYRAMIDAALKDEA